MMYTSKDFYESGTMLIDGSQVSWGYHQVVPITLHEKTLMFSCALLGSKNHMCLFDLKTKCRMKLRAAAKAEARRKYVANLDAKEKAIQDGDAAHA